MKLYGSYTSPYVRHCRIALLETNLPCEFIETIPSDPSNKSPTRKVPYLEDGDIGLSDSSSILRHIREKVGAPYLASVLDLDFFCLTNTLLDSATNVFLFERTDGLKPESSKYLARQAARVEAGLVELEQRELPRPIRGNDGAIRLGCFLAWGRFRKRFDLSPHARLSAFLAECDAWDSFAQTAPPPNA
jgi:glutathione S-transferase